MPAFGPSSSDHFLFNISELPITRKRHQSQRNMDNVALTQSFAANEFRSLASSFHTLILSVLLLLLRRSRLRNPDGLAIQPRSTNQKSVICSNIGSSFLDMVRSHILSAIQGFNSSGHFVFLQIFDKAEASRDISSTVAHDHLPKIMVSRARASQ